MGRQRNSNCWFNAVCQMDNECDSCIRYLEFKFLVDSSGLPKAKQRPITLKPDSCDFDAFCKLDDIKNDIVSFVESGNNLYIGGSVGTGKTSWAIKILLHYFNEIWLGNGLKVRGLFVQVPNLLNQLKDFNNPLSYSYRQALLTADLVVWDEIGDTGMSNYDYSQLLTILNDRLLNERSNIYTSNISNKSDSVKYLGARLSSRILNSSEMIILTGRDKR